MTLNKDKSPSIFKRWKGVVKNGLFLFGLRNRLALIGLNINPYYWEHEEVDRCDVPVIKNHTSEFVLKPLGLNEVELITNHLPQVEKNKIFKSFEKGQQCMGLENNGEIACYSFIELNDFEYNNKVFKLKSNEAYLLNMWTFHNYRGRNLAPYLRYQVYRYLEKLGVTVKYSISQYFNKSSIKFKKKLNSKHRYLILNIVLFSKIKWNFTLKKYDI